MFLRRKKKKKDCPSVTGSVTGRIGTDTTGLAEILEKKAVRGQPVLLAAECLADLPVTVAIHLGIHLARSQTCLMIDLDIKRDSLALVFEIDASIDSTLKLKPLPTALENLSVWPARFFSLSHQMNLKALLESAGKHYDYVLLYAPYLPALADRKQIAALSGHVVVFSGGNNKDAPLRRLLKSCNCRILHEF